MSVPMALVDYIPVVLFLVSAILLQHDLYNKMSKGAFSLLACGTIDIFMAGFLKATWKLLYALNVCDFTPLNKMFFPVQSIGFVLAGLSVICLLFVNQGKGKTYSFALLPMIVMAEAVAPNEFSGTMIFVSLMILGVLGLCGGMAIKAARMKKILPVIMYIVAFVCMLGMGYLSSKDFSKASMNWIAEFVNVAGQGLFLGATIILHKNGLDEEV